MTVNVIELTFRLLLSNDMSHILRFNKNQDLKKADIEVNSGFPCNAIQSGAKQCNAGVLDNSCAMEVSLKEVRGSVILTVQFSAACLCMQVHP